MTVEEFEHMVYASVDRSTICDSPFIVRQRGPSIKLRIDLLVGGFIEAYYNEETGTTAYALIQNGIRTFGADNATSWHYHSFESPGLHIALRTEMKFAEFLGEVERRLSQELS